MNRTKIFSGTSNRILAANIAFKLGMSLERANVGSFADGEVQIELHDNVRKSRAFIIQSTCAPANDTLMELILMADALHRSATKKIIAVIPYLGYSRQDRRPDYQRTPISAKVVADLIQSVRIDQIITIDLHTTQIQGFYNIPVDNISASRLFEADIINNVQDLTDLIVVSPDIGGVGRSRALAKHLGVDLAIIDKRRPKAGLSEVMNIIGDVDGKICIIVDDLIDSGGTLCKAADALTAKGAKKVVAYCTHGVLSGNANQNIEHSTLSELVITDTIPLHSNITSNKVRIITVADMLAETIKRLVKGDSISELSSH
jgi:ribose-phosphate pyrophosphokinase